MSVVGSLTAVSHGSSFSDSAKAISNYSDPHHHRTTLEQLITSAVADSDQPMLSLTKRAVQHTVARFGPAAAGIADLNPPAPLFVALNQHLGATVNTVVAKNPHDKRRLQAASTYGVDTFRATSRLLWTPAKMAISTSVAPIRLILLSRESL